MQLTAVGRAFMDHARLALIQVDAAVEAARRAAKPTKRHFALGFLTGQEMSWLPAAMHILRDELPTVDVTVSSDYAPDLAEAIARGRLDLAFLRADPDFDLAYQVVGKEPLVVLMPSDHPLTSCDLIHPQQLVGEPFIAMVNKAKVLRAVIDAGSGQPCNGHVAGCVDARRDVDSSVCTKSDALVGRLPPACR